MADWLPFCSTVCKLLGRGYDENFAATRLQLAMQGQNADELDAAIQQGSKAGLPDEHLDAAFRAQVEIARQANAGPSAAVAAVRKTAKVERQVATSTQKKVEEESLIGAEAEAALSMTVEERQAAAELVLNQVEAALNKAEAALNKARKKAEEERSAAMKAPRKKAEEERQAAAESARKKVPTLDLSSLVADAGKKDEEEGRAAVEAARKNAEEERQTAAAESARKEAGDERKKKCLLIVSIASGETELELEVGLEATIADLKQEIKNQRFYQTAQQTLLLHDQLLSDNVALEGLFSADMQPMIALVLGAPTLPSHENKFLALVRGNGRADLRSLLREVRMKSEQECVSRMLDDFRSQVGACYYGAKELEKLNYLVDEESKSKSMTFKDCDLDRQIDEFSRLLVDEKSKCPVLDAVLEHLQTQEQTAQREETLANMGPWSLSSLSDNAIWKAAGMPAESREQYLSDVEFQANFHMSKLDFKKLAAWKRDQLKKAVGLF